MNQLFYITSFFIFIQTVCGYDGALNISTEGTEYLPYEPIYIRCYYKGDQMISISPGADEITIHIRNTTANRETEFHPIEQIDKICANCSKSKMQPAEVYKVMNVLNITSDARGWLFEKPGDYLVWITLNSGDAPSNTVSIKIATPTGPDIAVAESIRKCPGFSMFVYLEGGDMFDKALAIAEKIAEGKSGYAAGMKDLLVKNYSQQSCSREGKTRLSDFEKVKRYYNSGFLTKRPISAVRTLTLMGRLAKITKSSQETEFVKREYFTLRTGKDSTAFTGYLHKKFVE
jgi:hypothetical protein